MFSEEAWVHTWLYSSPKHHPSVAFHPSAAFHFLVPRQTDRSGCLSNPRLSRTLLRSPRFAPHSAHRVVIAHSRGQPGAISTPLLIFFFFVPRPRTPFHGSRDGFLESCDWASIDSVSEKSSISRDIHPVHFAHPAHHNRHHKDWWRPGERVEMSCGRRWNANREAWF